MSIPFHQERKADKEARKAAMSSKALDAKEADEAKAEWAKAAAKENTSVARMEQSEKMTKDGGEWRPDADNEPFEATPSREGSPLPGISDVDNGTDDSSDSESLSPPPPKRLRRCARFVTHKP